MKSLRFLMIFAIILLSQISVVCGEEALSSSTAEVKIINSVTVAIIDFATDAPGNPNLGRQISDILTARLSIYDQFRLVERQKLEDLLREHQLNLTGMVDTNQAVKVGKMLGARIIIFGRAFVVDKDLYIVAKIVGTETSRVKGVMAKGKSESNLSDIIDQLVDKLADGLEKWTPQLLPKDEKFENKIENLKNQLAGKKLPTVIITIPEEHLNRQVIDPAAETEVIKIFKDVGFTVVENKSPPITKWARDFQKDPKTQIPPDMAEVDIIITGEGFSEFGTRLGELVACTARLEVKAIERNTTKIIASERTTRRAVDLSEAIAGKTALQAAGHELAIKLVEKIAMNIKND